VKKSIIILILLLLIVGGGIYWFLRPKSKEAGPEMVVHGMAPGWKFSLPQGDPAQGRQWFVKLECYKCHEIKGEEFPAVAAADKGVGPDLSQMAGLHPVEFFAESIINPNAVVDADAKEKGYLGADGKSKMPDYNDILTGKELADLAAYLTSLKAQEHKAH